MTHNRFYAAALSMALSVSMPSMWGMDQKRQLAKPALKQNNIELNGAQLLNKLGKPTVMLLDSCYKGDKFIADVKVAIADGANVNLATTEHVKSNALHRAAMNGNIRIVELLVEHGADVNALTFCGNGALQLAARGGHLNVVKFFVKEKKIDPNIVTSASKATPLHYASLGGHINVAEFLIDSGADVNWRTSDKATPLFYAMSQQRYPLVKFLVQKNADVTAAYQTGSTPLHIAVYSDAPRSIIELMVQSGADLEAKTIKNGVTPLLVAVDEKLPITKIELLLELGADPYAFDVAGRMALNLALNQGRIDVVQLLLAKPKRTDSAKRKHVNINAPLTNLGKTALHLAAEQGDIAAVKLLMDLGAQHTLAEGKYTPIDLANKNGHLKVVALINQYFVVEKRTKQLILEEDKKNALAGREFGSSKTRKNNQKKKAKKLAKKDALLQANGPLVAILEDVEPAKEIIKEQVIIAPVNQPVILTQDQIVFETNHNNSNFGSINYGDTRKMFVYPDHKRMLPFGTYFRGADGISFIPSGALSDNVGSQVAANHFKNVVYSKHVLSKMVPKDAHHNFPTIFEEQFGHLSCAVLADAKMTEQRKAYLKEQYNIAENIDDFWLEFVVEVPATITGAGFPEKKALAQQPEGIVEIRGLKKSLADGEMLVVHRFYKKNK